MRASLTPGEGTILKHGAVGSDAAAGPRVPTAPPRDGTAGGGSGELVCLSQAWPHS